MCPTQGDRAEPLLNNLSCWGKWLLVAVSTCSILSNFQRPAPAIVSTNGGRKNVRRLHSCDNSMAHENADAALLPKMCAVQRITRAVAASQLQMKATSVQCTVCTCTSSFKQSSFAKTKLLKKPVCERNADVFFLRPQLCSIVCFTHAVDESAGDLLGV